MYNHNMLICKICHQSVVKENLQFILWKHLVVCHQISKQTSSNHLDEFEDNINLNQFCMDAESSILQPDLLSPVIQDIIKLVEDLQASGQPIVTFYQWYNFILKSDTLKLLESNVRGVTKFDILEYFINKLARGGVRENRTPETHL